MSSLCRLFFAVSLPQTMISDCQAVQKQLRPMIPGARWTSPDSMHITLLFLARVPATDIPALQQALDVAVEPLGPFTLKLGEIGTFGPRRSPRVVWLGVESDQHALNQIHQRLTASVSALGLPVEDRPFRSHITLARIRPGQRRLAALTETLSSVSVPTRAHEAVMGVHLIESRLSKTGAIHQILHTANL